MLEAFTVALIDDDESILDALQLFFSRRRLTVLCFSSAKHFLAALDAQARFDCIVSDVRMRGLSGLALQRILNERRITSPLIFITGHGEVDMAVCAMKAGAFDFFEKPIDEKRLLACIRCAVVYAREKQAKEQQLSQLSQRYATLSKRQREVMALVLRGSSNKEIAVKLEISAKTVEHYREGTMQRMQATSLAELVQIGMRLNIGNEN